MHNSSRNSATIIRKFRDQGSKFRHETKGLLPSFATIQEVHIQNVHSSPYGKTEKDFLIIACIIAAETRLLLLGNFETKARNLAMKPKGLLASYATILGSLHSKRTPIPIRKNGERLPIVACVKAAETRLLSLGKTSRRFHRLTHDRNKIWYYTYLKEQY